MKKWVCRYVKQRPRKRDKYGRFVREKTGIDWKQDNRVLLVSVCVFVLGPVLLETVQPGGVSVSSLVAGKSTSAATDARKRDNSARLQKINPVLRPKVAAILSDLEQHGYQPVIDQGVWRSAAQQAAKKASGVSTVSYSYHNATTPSGAPDALAADIFDKRWGWNNTKQNREFWLKLASSAQAHGMTTGIYWGLSQANRDRLRAAIKAKNWNYSGPLGWDTAHVEVVGISLAQARAGVRPKPAPVAPLLVINDVPVRRGAAYLANGSWHVIETDLAPLFGKAAPASLPVALRPALDGYGHAVVATNNRLSERNRFDVRTAPKQ